MSYRLSHDQVEFTLGMLEREQRAHPIGTLERASYPVLQVCIAVYVVSGASFLIDGWLTGFRPSRLLTTFLILYIAFSGLAICWFMVNLFLARRFRKQLRMLKFFGILQVLDDPWEAERRRAGFGRFFSALVLIIGCLGTVTGVMALIAWIAIARPFDSPSTEALAIGLGISSVVMTSLVLVGYYFLRRAHLRHRLVSEAGRLQALLRKGSSHEGEGTVLESATYQQLAAIERAQIHRTRLAAIQRSLDKTESPGLAIARSQVFTEEQTKLKPESTLSVEHAIQALAANPKPEQAQFSKESNAFVLPVEGTGASIVYTVDDDARRIVVQRLRHSASGDTRA